MWTAKKMNKWVLEQIQPETGRSKNDKTVSYFRHIVGRQGSLEKIVMLEK